MLKGMILQDCASLTVDLNPGCEVFEVNLPLMDGAEALAEASMKGDESNLFDLIARMDAKIRSNPELGYVTYASIKDVSLEAIKLKERTIKRIDMWFNLREWLMAVELMRGILIPCKDSLNIYLQKTNKSVIDFANSAQLGVSRMNEILEIPDRQTPADTIKLRQAMNDWTADKKSLLFSQKLLLSGDL